MKIRSDFVTNSSSSSFVCIEIKSNKLREILDKYNIALKSKSKKYNVVLKGEDCSSGGTGVESVDEALRELIEILECQGEDLLSQEIENNFAEICEDIEALSYEYGSSGYGEFEDSEDSCEFVYTKPKATPKTSKKSANKPSKYNFTKKDDEYHSLPNTKRCFGVDNMTDKFRSKIKKAYIMKVLNLLKTELLLVAKI